MEIRHARPQDADAVARIEALCFPAAEAATPGQMCERIASYPECFWLGFEDGELVAFVNGMASDGPDLVDGMFADASLHKCDGAWQMIFSVSTHPDHRRRGHAAALLERCIADTRERGREGLVLTCKDALVAYYARFGFEDEGICASEHGGVSWHQMRLTF